MEKYPFVKCLNPLKICNQYTKEPLLVGCGKCEACRLQKSSMRALKCKLESLSHKYSLFVTLTYSNEYIPKMRVHILNDAINLMVEKRKMYFYDVCERNNSCGEILSEVKMRFSDLDKLRKKTNLGDDLPYLNKYDAQKFMKRLRKNLTKYTDEKIRYYLVGELGPVHFRPHFHLLLWFSEEQTKQIIHECIHKSWPFGRIDIQKPTGSAASYVAGYLNGFSNLPRVYQTGKCKPFACHSQFLGEKILKAEKEEVYKLSAEQFIQRSIAFDGSYSEFSLWRSFKTAYYPRSPKFATLTHEQRLTSYLTYAATSEIFGKTSSYKQAKEVVDDIISGHFVGEYPVLDYFAKTYNIHPFLGYTDYHRRIRQVYQELRCSEHFLRFVCDGIDNITHQDSMLRMIEHFYAQCDMLNLNQQMINQDEFLQYDGCSLDDLIYFYDNKFFDSSKFKQQKVFNEFQEQQLNKARDSVKHKVLNDKNKIFENI